MKVDDKLHPADPSRRSYSSLTVETGDTVVSVAEGHCVIRGALSAFGKIGGGLSDC